MLQVLYPALQTRLQFCFFFFPYYQLPPALLETMNVGISNHPSCAFPSLWLFASVPNKLKCHFQNLMQPIFRQCRRSDYNFFFFILLFGVRWALAFNHLHRLPQ